MGERARVLQLSTMVPPARFGGAERVVAAFGDQLRADGFSVRDHGLRARRQPGSETPIRNLYWPFDGGSRGVAARTAWHAVDALTLAARKSVERLVDDFAPDVLITHNLRGWGLAPWAVAEKRGIRLIHVIHDYGLLCNNSTMWHSGMACDGSHLPCRLRGRAAVSRWPGGHLVGVSEAVLSEHRRRGFGASDPTAVIHPVMAALDPRTTTPKQTPTFPTIFGFLGRLTPEKGIGHLVEAIAGTDAQLVVAGEGEASQLREWQTRAGDRVRWLGWTDPVTLFDAIDVLVVPSLWREPFGLVVVEAAKAGVPVLLADQPGLIEAARSCGARYSSYAAGTPGALRAALSLPSDSYRADPIQTPPVDIVDLVAGLVDKVD